MRYRVQQKKRGRDCEQVLRVPVAFEFARGCYKDALDFPASWINDVGGGDRYFYEHPLFGPGSEAKVQLSNKKILEKHETKSFSRPALKSKT